MFSRKSLRWTELEVNAFYEGLVKFRKDFKQVSGQVGSKTTKECVEFYYFWKNFCRDEVLNFKSIFFNQPFHYKGGSQSIPPTSG